MTGTVSGAQLRAFIERIERLEEEKRTIADDIKEVKAEAKGCGFDVATINAIIKLRKKDAAERDEAQAMLELYMSALGMLPLFEPEQSYSEAKGRGFVAKLTDEQMAAALAYDGEDSPVGELTDNQESGTANEVRAEEVVTPPAGTLDGVGSAVSPASDESEQDDVGATASSTNSAHKPAGDLAADNGDKDRGSFPVGGPVHSHSPAAIPLGAANSAGGAPSSSPASPARHSDDIDLTIPAFLRRDEGRGYPKREAVDA